MKKEEKVPKWFDYFRPPLEPIFTAKNPNKNRYAIKPVKSLYGCEIQLTREEILAIDFDSMTFKASLAYDYGYDESETYPDGSVDLLKNSIVGPNPKYDQQLKAYDKKLATHEKKHREWQKQMTQWTVLKAERDAKRLKDAKIK